MATTRDDTTRAAWLEQIRADVQARISAVTAAPVTDAETQLAITTDTATTLAAHAAQVIEQWTATVDPDSTLGIDPTVLYQRALDRAAFPLPAGSNSRDIDRWVDRDERERHATAEVDSYAGYTRAAVKKLAAFDQATPTAQQQIIDQTHVATATTQAQATARAAQQYNAAYGRDRTTPNYTPGTTGHPGPRNDGPHLGR